MSDRIEADCEKLALRITGEMSAELSKCVIVREDGTEESIPWRMEMDGDEVRFVPRGPVLLGPNDVISWHWKEWT